MKLILEMAVLNMRLTKTDRLILESYVTMLSGLSAYLGSAYEISLHSLENYQHSVIKIFNGYHSGRHEGAPITDLALNMLTRIQDDSGMDLGVYYSYHTTNKSGENLKSSTIPIYGENGRIIGLICINLYLDSPLSEILESLAEKKEREKLDEHFSTSVDDTIINIVSEVKNQVMFNSNIPAVNRNKTLIEVLYKKGLFNMKDSVSLVADILGISKNTVYLHLRNIKKEFEEET